MASPFFTVFTPTHNRAHTLRKPFESLLQQTFRDFEWLVVDDGSTDNTRDLIEAWAREAWFPVRYFYQTHKHKKAAFNLAAREAQGYLLADLDSDDEFFPDTLETFYRVWHEIPEEQRERFVGVTGLCVYENGQVVGDPFPYECFDASVLDVELYKWKLKGDKSGCMRVDLLRRFPFPEDVQGYVVLNIVWEQIARAGYLTRFINKPVLLVHETPNSLIRTGNQNIKYAEGLGQWTAITLDADLSKYFWRNPVFFIKLGAGLTRYHWHMRDQGISRRWQLTSPIARLFVSVLYPIGIVLYYRDRWIARLNDTREVR
ncbi:MAG: glycosyl transferase [Armatimonadota bacterium]|nr:MAG: glycosyl transferase [Armatimonadota bacterium]